MAVNFKRKNGKVITLLNPSEKGHKFATELRDGIKYTNAGLIKTDKNNNYQHLTDTESAYRSGYLAAQKDSANCYKAKQGKKCNSSKRNCNNPAVHK